MEYSITILHSSRKTIMLTVVEGPQVIIKAPYFLSSAETCAIVEKHKKWIQKQIALLRERQKNARQYSPEEIAAFRMQAEEIVSNAVTCYAPRMGVMPSAVKITSAAKQWGSCNGRNSLCFSWHIALLPPEAANYVVVHELAHIHQKNHGPKFYAEVEKILPDYKDRIRQLKQAQRDLGL